MGLSWEIVPRAGFEPALREEPHFECGASTNAASGACLPNKARWHGVSTGKAGCTNDDAAPSIFLKNFFLAGTNFRWPRLRDATADTPGCGCEGDPRAMCTLLGLNPNVRHAQTSNMIEPMRRPRRTNASVRRSVAQTAKESTMVFKEGTFKSEQPQHFEGPHPA